jgi:DNA polymerase III alpha subunit
MEDRTVIQWEKDDIDELGMMKVDVPGLRMLTMEVSIAYQANRTTACFGCQTMR